MSLSGVGTQGAEAIIEDDVEERRIAEEEAQARALVNELDDPHDSDSDSEAESRFEDEDFIVNGKATRYQAELQVLRGIATPRKSLAKEGVSLARKPDEKPWLTPAEADLEQRLRPDYLKMTKKELEGFRPEIPINEEREYLVKANELARVQILPRLPGKTESSTGLSKVKDMSKSRQLRHDEALRGFKVKVAEISDALEKKVIDFGRDLRDKLEAMDEAIREVVLELRDEAQLRMQDYEYVCQAWVRLGALCEERKQAILSFDAALDAVEENRTVQTSTELSSLVEGLVAISYKLQGEIARIAEREAHEINIVVINNLKIKNDLTARMLRHQVSVFHHTKAHWERAETRWRFLRHERALHEWSDLLDSDRFCDPSERHDIILEAEKSQRVRHEEQRLELISDLQHLVPTIDSNASEIPLNLPHLTMERINEIRQTLQKLDEEENLECEQLAEALLKHEGEMKASMEQTQEALRAEIHEYAALADLGDIFTQGERGRGAEHRMRLHNMMTDDNLDDFFRRSGGLKSELTNIVTTLAKPQLIYNEHLEKLLYRIELLVEARGIMQLHEDEGKSSDLKGIQSTLEKLRVGATSELAPLVPILHRQATLLLLTCSPLGNYLEKEITEAIRLLEEVDPSLNNEANEDESSISGESKTESSSDIAPQEVAGAVSRVSQSEHDNKEDDTEAFESHQTYDPNSAELAYKAKPINLVDLRTAQKMLGTLVHTSSLPIDILNELQACRDTLRIQVNVNTTVDGVIAKHCTDRVILRQQEIKAYRQALNEHMAKQAQRLAFHSKSLCDFVAGCAQILQASREGDEQTDINFENALDHLADNFEESDGRKEKQFTETVERLRHAPDRSSLNEYFEEALQLLAEIDAGYRKYHHDGVVLSREHPKRAENEAYESHCKVATHFGFQHTTKAASEPSSLEINTPIKQAYVEEGKTEDIRSRQPLNDEVDPLENSIANDGGGSEVKEGLADPELVDEYSSEDGGLSPGDDVEKNSNSGTEEDTNQSFKERSIDPGETPSEGDSSTLRPLSFIFKSKFHFEQDRTSKDLAVFLLKLPLSEEEKAALILEDERTHQEDAVSDSGSQNDVVAPENDNEQALNVDAKDVGVEDDIVDDKCEISSTIEMPVDALDKSKESEKPEAHASKPIQSWASLSIKEEHVIPLIEQLRDAVFASTCEYRAHRESEMESLCSERCEDYTEELEERLRLHWPRKGRTDVKFQQPRAGELLQHQQRHDRHVRAFQLKNTHQGQQFQRKLGKVKEALRKFKQFMNGLQLHLEAQSNAAALQGLAKKGKDTVASFKDAMEDEKEALMPFVRRNNELLDMNRQFLSTCTPFESGGDYNQDEIANERRALALVEERVIRDIQTRAEELQSLFTLIKDTRVTMSSALTQNFEQCLQALSVGEGLGRKYGAPRRKAQERLRSELSRSKAGETFIDGLIRELEMLIHSASAQNIAEETKSLALRIKIVIDSIRKCTWRRAKYLEFLKDFDQAPKPETLELQDLPNDPLVEGMNEEAVTVAMGTGVSQEGTFRAVLESAQAQCRKDTTELYEAEGMMSELLESGKRLTPDGELLPESLVVFLREFEEKGRQAQEDASRRLREQITHTQELLVEAPAVALGYFVLRAQYYGNLSREDQEADFAEFHRRSEKMRLGHRNLLRPIIGDPNHKMDLAQLCESEKSRLESSREKLQSTHTEILQGLRKEADTFSEALKLCSCTLLMLLDSMILPIDLRALPGDDEVVTKRMGLRRLRKTRLQVETKEQNDADGLANMDPRGLVRKSWPILDSVSLNKLRTAFDNRLDEGLPEPGSEGDVVQTPSQILVDSKETLDTMQHRSVILERHRAYDSFVEWFREACTGVDTKFRGMLAEENRWSVYWGDQLEKLTKL